MRFNSLSFVRNIFLLVALVSSLLLTACGGGGGGGGGGDSLRDALVGIWYLNLEDGKPVVPNAKGEVSSMILKSDGTCTMKDFDLTDKNHSTYWEPEGTAYSDKGTWRYADGRLYIKIDGQEVGISVSINNGALTMSGTYEDSSDTWTSTYKKTKYGESEDSGGGSSQPVAQINSDLVGTWYLNFEDGLPVVPNSKGDVSTMILKSDGTCTMKDYNLTTSGHSSYFEPEGTAYTDTGKWSYSNGKLTTVIDGYTMSVSVTLKDGSLTLNGTEPEPWTSIYKKTKYSESQDSGGGSNQPVNPSNPTTITKNDLVGTWYLNYEDNKPVHPNSKGEVDTITLKSDGTVIWKEFDLTDYGHSSYWEPEGVADTVSGKWSYSNGKLTTTIEGYTISFPITLNNGALSLTGTYEGSTETWTSTYKKTKYSL